MSNQDNQVMRNMQADDRAYGENNAKKIVVQKDKSHKHPKQFNRMSVKDLLSMEDGGDYEEEDYEVDQM